MAAYKVEKALGDLVQLDVWELDCEDAVGTG
jgi:hypothetical protein